MVAYRGSEVDLLSQLILQVEISLSGMHLVNRMRDPYVCIILYHTLLYQYYNIPCYTSIAYYSGFLCFCGLSEP